MPYFFWDSTLLILIPGILLALFAQSYVSSTYRKYSAVATHGGLLPIPWLAGFWTTPASMGYKWSPPPAI